MAGAMVVPLLIEKSVPRMPLHGPLSELGAKWYQ